MFDQDNVIMDPSTVSNSVLLLALQFLTYVSPHGGSGSCEAPIKNFNFRHSDTLTQEIIDADFIALFEYIEEYA